MGIAHALIIRHNYNWDQFYLGFRGIYNDLVNFDKRAWVAIKMNLNVQT